MRQSISTSRAGRLLFSIICRAGAQRRISIGCDIGGRFVSNTPISVTVRRSAAVLHLAAQVAVTTSVSDPREDFEINALGTFNVLEAVRLKSPDSFFINASTNKVYGKMEDIGVVERNGRYEYLDLPNGVGEDRPLGFHSPYGCSKGVADQSPSIIRASTASAA